ncbi:hypothetical protein C8R43DRAFT_960544 [Mycena crocata]|nr:hypothetical protein C8R43DRAFT_960544 [Mycena crocata]
MRAASPFFLVLTASLSRAFVNITVDDSDSSITFTSQNCVPVQPDARGSWEVFPGRFVNSCHNKTLRRCDDVGATAVFKFTDSNESMYMTIADHSDPAHIDASSPIVWGVSGLANTQHTLSIRRHKPGGSLYVDAFIYTALRGAPLFDRRSRKGGSGPEDDDSETDSDEKSDSENIVSESAPTSSKSTSAPSTSTTPPPIATSPNVSQSGTIAITLGTVLGVLVLAIISFFAWRRRRRPHPNTEEKTPSPPYTASSSSGVTRPPSMRERSDRFSNTHTPAGTPLTRTPASILTSLSANNMHLAHLPPLTSEKGHSPSNGTISDDESNAQFEAPPPRYDVVVLDEKFNLAYDSGVLRLSASSPRESRCRGQQRKHSRTSWSSGHLRDSLNAQYPRDLCLSPEHGELRNTPLANAGFGIIADLDSCDVRNRIARSAASRQSRSGSGVAPWRSISLFLGTTTIVCAIASRILKNKAGRDVTGIQWDWLQVAESFTDPQFYFCVLNGGLTTFGNIMCHSFGFTELEVLLISIPRSVVSVLVFVAVGILTRRVKNMRMWVMTAATVPPFVGILPDAVVAAE